MNRRFLHVLVALVLIAVPAAVYAQTAQSKETLIQSIKQRAEQDVESDSSKATPQDLDILFGKEAAAAQMSMQEVVQTYEQAYRAAKQKVPWWKGLLPHPGWIVAAILGLLLIIQESVRKGIATVVENLLKKLYKRAAGYKLFQQKALRNYRKALIEKYQHFKIPFRADRDLDMTKIYIPLKIKGTSDAELIEDADLLTRFKRIVVIGAPGSGKSMLLKRIALSRAFKPLRTGNRTPIIVDLRRFNEGDLSLNEHLITIMELNDFPNAGAFIESSLNAGTLLLLFDGLDEVANIRQGSEPTKREITVRKIIDLLDKYENCPAIITCRTAVYRRDFDEIAERTLEIVEFSDQQIQNFLMSWPNPPADKPIEQLIASLSDRPAILALARNPLLLTIVAFLYTDMAEFQLPYSRTEFYSQAVDVLLQQLKGGLNRYRLAPKLLVLERLALFNQEKDSNVADRLTIDEPTVLRLINDLLPSLSLDSKDVTPLLQEIVERSNLLLEVDNKTKYQFFHLTLQEYFAATALRNDANKLLRNFQANKDAWRETVKLWCGLPHDSTELIKAVSRIDILTAFECLADAPMVKQPTADAIINHFKPLLGTRGEQSEAITKAFSGVATGRSQRGGAVLSFLMNELNTSPHPNVKQAAAEALALSNKQDAVRCLSTRYDSDPDIVRPAIIKMGNIAVTSLKRLAETEHTAAINALHAIGTTKGIVALIPLLWHKEGGIQTMTALKLAQTASQRNGLEFLSEYTVNSQQRSQPWYEWVWAPFVESEGESIQVIIGRIAYLLDHATGPTPAGSVEADWRIVVPLILKERERTKTNLHSLLTGLSRHDLVRILKDYQAQSIVIPSYNIEAEFGDSKTVREYELQGFLRTLGEVSRVRNKRISTELLLIGLGAPIKLAFLVGLMPLQTQVRFLTCLVNKKQPFMDRWQYIRRPKKPLRSFWPYTLLLLLIAVLSCLSVTELIGALRAQDHFGWRSILYVYLIVSVFGGWALTAFGLKNDTYDKFFVGNLGIALLSFFYPVVLIVDIRNQLNAYNLEFTFLEHLQGFSSAGFTAALIYGSSVFLLRYCSGRLVCFVWIGIIVFAGVVAVAIGRHLRRYDNPLRRFAELQQQPI